MRRKIEIIQVILCVCILLGGCSFSKASDKKIREMAFTIEDENQLIEEVVKMIEAKKENAFQLAYHTEEVTYIILGYGMQETSGYHIQVNEVYEGEDSVWVDTDLIGPQKGETVEQSPTYPYVIIKTEKIDQLIRFKS